MTLWPYLDVNWKFVKLEAKRDDGVRESEVCRARNTASAGQNLRKVIPPEDVLVTASTLLAADGAVYFTFRMGRTCGCLRLPPSKFLKRSSVNPLMVNIQLPVRSIFPVYHMKVRFCAA